MYLLFDIGGTNMRLGISSDGKKLKKVKKVATPADFASGMRVFADVARELCGKKKIRAIVGGIAGPLNKDRSAVFFAPHLSGWNQLPLKAHLSYLTEGLVYIENDAALAGVGEARYGAGKGKRIIMYYTVSTGVGGARIVDGRIDQATCGFEPGHQIVAAPQWGEKHRQEPMSLEDYVGGRGIKERFCIDSSQIDDPSVWETASTYLAYGLYNSILHWSPDVVVLGGALIIKNAIPMMDVRLKLRKMLTIFPTLPPLRKARLGEFAGLYGALAVAQKF